MIRETEITFYTVHDDTEASEFTIEKIETDCNGTEVIEQCVKEKE